VGFWISMLSNGSTPPTREHSTRCSHRGSTVFQALLGLLTTSHTHTQASDAMPRHATPGKAPRGASQATKRAICTVRRSLRISSQGVPALFRTLQIARLGINRTKTIKMRGEQSHQSRWLLKASLFSPFNLQSQIDRLGSQPHAASERDRAPGLLHERGKKKAGEWQEG